MDHRLQGADLQTLLVRPEEAAAVLAISRSSVYSLIARGVLPTVFVGSSRRIRREDLEKFVSELPQAAKDETGAAPDVL
jgi:excisionase family DNA binding protein